MFLPERLFARGSTSEPVPPYIQASLRYPLRPYQQEALRRFIRFWHAEYEGKPQPPHVLFNMATGSGKTLVMAGLMLWLYRQGYRRFLFFVHSTHIIRQTTANFTEPATAKYLFRAPIHIDGRPVRILPTHTFDEADPAHINVKFTTIQQLHLDLTATREQAPTLENLREERLVLIADEAHHFSSGTRKADLSRSWEETVERVHRLHPENVLLEFTATLDLDHPDIRHKYAQRILYRYDLRHFRQDGYSKEIQLVRSHYDERERILQALVLHLYRQELAIRYGLNLKPVILFKARRTIRESEANKERFHRLIATLNATAIRQLRRSARTELVQRAFAFFDSVGLDEAAVAAQLRFYFKPGNCISANDDEQVACNQMLLHTLEDEGNPIRAVFAVQKLNEGWDVRNLFDIVRLYDGSDGRKDRPGKTTLSEAQLIGRGARYYPFRLTSEQDPYRRKFDHDPQHELRLLETLCYHTREDNHYVAELKQALTDSGLWEKHPARRPAQHAKAHPRRHHRGSPFPLPQTPAYVLPSGAGTTTLAWRQGEADLPPLTLARRHCRIGELPVHLVRHVLAASPLFRFDRLKRHYPELRAMSEFIRSSRYLGAQPLVIEGPPQRLEALTHQDYCTALRRLLPLLEAALLRMQ